MTASEAVREGEAPSVKEAERESRRIARSTSTASSAEMVQAPAPAPKADTAVVKKAAARKLAKASDRHHGQGQGRAKTDSRASRKPRQAAHEHAPRSSSSTRTSSRSPTPARPGWSPTLLDLQAAGRAPHVSLTGGSLGSAIIASILQVPARTAVDWSTVSVWWGDERYLPAGDADRNDTQNDAAGLDRLGLDPANVHRVAGPDASDVGRGQRREQYSAAVRGSGGGEFDIMILGVGPDGHVASLFPGHPAQLTTDAIAVAVHDSPKPPPDRVSLTFECLTRSDRVWFLVAGRRQGARRCATASRGRAASCPAPRRCTATRDDLAGRRGSAADLLD